MEKREEGGGKEEKKIRPPGPPREGLLEEFEIKDQGTGAARPSGTVRDSPGHQLS